MSERPGSSFEIPDLELEAPVSKREAPQGRREAPRASAVNELDFGGDDFELVPTGAVVQLATAPLAEVQPKSRAVAWPTGRTREAGELRVAESEVQRVADYGAAPQSALGSPVYAYRVWARRKPLRAAVAEHHAALTRAERERDTALMQLALELRGALAAHDVFRRLLEPVRDIEQLAGDRSAALIEADATYRARLADFDARSTELGTELGRAVGVVAEKRALTEAAAGELARTEAKHQRLQIELRGVMDLARRELGAAGGDLPPAHATRVAQLQAQLQAEEPALTRARQRHSAESAVLAAAEQDERRARSTIQQLEREKAGAITDLQRKRTARADGVSEAEKQRRDAWAAVARGVLSARGTLPVAEPMLEALRGLDERADVAAARLETYLRALDAYDHERARQGSIVALVAIGVVLLTISLAVMR